MFLVSNLITNADSEFRSIKYTLGRNRLSTLESDPEVRTLTLMETPMKKPDTVVRLYDEKARLYKFVMKDKGPLQSLEAIENALVKLGLSKNEIRVYVYLARTGMLKASEISEVISLHRTETYRILRDLEKIGLVSSVFEKPLKFVATPFEKTLDILIESKKLRLQLLERKKNDLVSLWVALPKAEVELSRKEVFQILEGEEQINIKAEEILEKSKSEVCMFASDSDIAHFYHSGLLDKLERIEKKDFSVRLLASDSAKSKFFIKELKLNGVRSSATCPEDLSSFIIVDQEQLLFLINKNGEPKDAMEEKKEKLAALWTNYQAFIKALSALFSELWNS
jgi:sugar-specific transcriptional regulator TrmB